jgi:hypothetical protein
LFWQARLLFAMNSASNPTNERASVAVFGNRHSVAAADGAATPSLLPMVPLVLQLLHPSSNQLVNPRRQPQPEAEQEPKLRTSLRLVGLGLVGLGFGLGLVGLVWSVSVCMGSG